LAGGVNVTPDSPARKQSYPNLSSSKLLR
jgi:hypothetical protein